MLFRFRRFISLLMSSSLFTKESLLNYVCPFEYWSHNGDGLDGTLPRWWCMRVAPLCSLLLDAITDVLQVMLNMCVPFYTNSREQQTTHTIMEMGEMQMCCHASDVSPLIGETGNLSDENTASRV